MAEIDFNLYNNLKLLLWDRPLKRLSPQETFYLLDERLAKYLAPSDLTIAEKELVQELAQVYGGGIIDGWEF